MLLYLLAARLYLSLSLCFQGLWLELEVMYTGCLQMTLETKMNLCKLGKDGEDEAHSVPETQQVG